MLAPSSSHIWIGKKLLSSTWHLFILGLQTHAFSGARRARRVNRHCHIFLQINGKSKQQHTQGQTYKVLPQLASNNINNTTQQFYDTLWTCLNLTFRSTIKLYQILTTTTTPTHSSPAATPPPPPLDPATPHLPSSCSSSSFILLCPLSCLCYFYCHSLLSTLPPSYTTTSVLSSAGILLLACPLAATHPPSSWSSPSPASASTSATTFSLHLLPSPDTKQPPYPFYSILPKRNFFFCKF